MDYHSTHMYARKVYCEVLFLQGFRCIQADECWHKSLTPLMKEVRDMMGDKPVYISFDIDGLDPCYAPGTGKFSFTSINGKFLFFLKT